MIELFGSFSFIIVIALFFIASSFRILSEWERGVVLRLGRAIGLKGPGVILLVPLIDRLIRVDTRTVTMDVPAQDIITRDNVSMKVSAVVYFRVVEPVAAITEVEDYIFASSQLSQTTLRSILGQFQMDEILSQRESINLQLQKILDEATEKWGIKITVVELKNIDLPKEMQKAMARQAEAERERRAKIISAEGELQRAEKLADAAKKLAESPAAIQLAYMQTLSEISGDKTNTIIFPLPMEQIGSFLGKK